MGLFDEKKEPIIFHLGVDEQASYYLLQTIKWKKFMAIMGIILTAILFLAGIGSLLGGMALSGTGGSSSMAGFTMIYAITIFALSLLYIYPIVCLLRFCSNMKTGLAASDGISFNRALMYQRNLWRFMGILMIVLLVLYGAIILFSLSQIF